MLRPDRRYRPRPYGSNKEASKYVSYIHFRHPEHKVTSCRSLLSASHFFSLPNPLHFFEASSPDRYSIVNGLWEQIANISSRGWILSTFRLPCRRMLLQTFSRSRCPSSLRLSHCLRIVTILENCTPSILGTAGGDVPGNLQFLIF